MQEKVESIIERDGLDQSKLGFSFTRILSEAVGDMRADQRAADEKINKIEVELDEIASNVKQNINKLFERGEKVGVLASKSEALKTSVSLCLATNFLQSQTLKRRASSVRQKSERGIRPAYLFLLAIVRDLV